VIGKGSFGKVMLVRKKDDGAVYAMKVLRKDAIIKRRQVAHTQAERDILTQLKHPFIVNLNFAFQTRDKLFMILDFINGGELFFHLKNEGRFSENRVKLYVAEIAAAMEHCHSIGVVYRDIKPENILLDKEGHIVITDFGLCKQIDDGGTKTFWYFFSFVVLCSNSSLSSAARPSIWLPRCSRGRRTRCRWTGGRWARWRLKC
jgi:serine/threonine protein kinase